ncbi:hypothetical protein LX64_00472 [Chitinophaga skermanii]|uniref:YD repeat-containing protein n=1 Tax=Chitinophaga skermanii TaxID=331697 RepID=A0A327R3T1_9BACT|nr:hypothetical protein [Chitinophaga skermanii]RAJ10865.1 hypothetical protein LX64_00472 [Chitinophaga skermanii]
MKRIIIAIACLAVGFSAYAADSNTPTAHPKNISVGTKKSEGKDFFRIQRTYLIEDACGQIIYVYVSAPHGTSNTVMYDCAYDYVMGCLNSNGCYQ